LQKSVDCTPPSLTFINLHARDSHQRPSRRCHTPVCALTISTGNMSTGVTTSPDGESLYSWATSNNLGLLYDPKETAIFSSHRWKVGTNPDQVFFASFGQDSRLPHRRVLRNFPRSQHRPSLITPPRVKVLAHSNPVKRWNFRKADWKRVCLLTGESVAKLPSLDTANIVRAYQDFCESLLSAAKQCIPRGRRKNCAMLGQRVRDLLVLLYPSPNEY